MIEIVDGLDCERHPSMALIVTVSMDGVVHLHRHVELPHVAAALGDLVEQIRADLLAEAAGW